MTKIGGPVTAEWIASVAVPDGECRLWRGPVSATGYPVANRLAVAYRPARVVYEATHGSVPRFVSMTCGIKRCVAPAHLSATRRVSKATCHPELVAYAKGLCRKCYKHDQYSTKTDYFKNAKVRSIYGISLDEYRQRRAADTHCTICGASEPKYLDHNHTTGAIRRFLCSRCNALLGFLERTAPDVLLRAQLYIATDGQLDADDSSAPEQPLSAVS